MKKLTLLLVFCSFSSIITEGQVNPGFPSWSGYDSHEADTINLQNLNVVLSTPVRSKSGAFPFRFGIVGNFYIYEGYNASTRTNQWYPSADGGGGSLPTLYAEANGVLVGNSGGTGNPIGFSTSFPQCPNGQTTTKYSTFFVTFGDQTIHWLPSSDYADSLGCLNASFTDQVVDGTGYTVSWSLSGGIGGVGSSTVYDRSGAVISWPVGETVLTDSNGIHITWNISTGEYTDTLGLTALTQTGNIQTPTFTWTDVNGGSPQVAITGTTYTLQSAFGCSGIADYNIASRSLPTNISFPDSTALTLAYEPTPGNSANRTGRLAQIKLRSGGSITYNWNPNNYANDGFSCVYQVPDAMTRTTSDGTTTYTWALTNNGSGHYGNTTTVVDQGGNKTVYTFTGLTATGNAAPPVTQALTQVQHYQGASTLLTTDVFCYNTAFSGCSFTSAPTTIVSGPITSVIALHKINGMSNSSATETHYDTFGNVTYAAQYDFGSSTPTTSVTTTYGTWNGSACVAIGNNVNNKPCDVLTTQAGVNIAESHFTNDSHGNLLKTSLWNGSAWIGQTTQNSFNPNGTPSTTYDVANNPTTYGYNGASYSHCSSCTQFPFPTSITKGGLTTSATWDGYGGVRLTGIDASQSTTTYGYGSDPFNRVTSLQDPLGNTVYTTYPSGSSPDTASSSFTFNSGNSVQNTTVTTDGYGRPTNVQKQQGPSSSNYDTVSTVYGWSGNYRTVAGSQPCTTTSGGTCTTVHTQYMDPLGRSYQQTTTSNETVQHTYTENDNLTVLSPAPAGENNKQVQREYDGLGRLTKSCSIGNGSTTACGQNTGSQNGVTTSVSYMAATGSTTVSSTRGVQTRSTTYDALGRVIQYVTPEGGTTSNYYDSYSSCPAGYRGATGKLAATKDADGNVLCYSYDSLNRVTGINANGTTCRHFYYDNSSGYSGTLPSGVTLSNQYGRMVEAATDKCASNTLITDEWFAYDKDGNLADVWQMTPHSGTYYHSHATFAGNGTLLTVQLANPSLYTETYGLDGEGRPATLVSSSTTVIAGTTYNAASQPTYIDLGTGTDQDAYVYDPNTGRMTNWTFYIGSSSETGALTWSANGSLRQLAIVDGFYSGGTQTCTFGTSSVMGYDDFGRLLGDNCGSVWSQTFSYDQYDNLTKAGSSAWNPGYNAANNHYASSATYDNAGNVLSDPVHNYKWNEFGKVGSIDSSTCGTNGECVTYDALGRLVEASYNTAFTEYWYTQAGKAYMTGSIPQYAYWKTPGSGTLEANGNAATHYYMHMDWLGNSRISSGVVNHAVLADQAYAPYGEVYDKQATQPGTPALMFTGDTQDIIGGIYDTSNRELNASQGRWLSPDPAGVGWNRYAYPANPLSFVDPTGLGPCAQFVGVGGHSVKPNDACYNPCEVDGGNICDGGGGGGGGAGGGSLLGYSDEFDPSDSVVPCPDNVCWGYYNGQYYQFMAAAGGAQGYVNLVNVTQDLNEWGGNFYGNAQFQQIIQQQIEIQKEQLTDAISMASDSPDGSNWDDIYNSLTFERIRGGHADFSWNWQGDPAENPDPTVDFVPGKDWSNGGCSFSCRYGSMDQIHLNNNMFHLDTVGVNWAFPLGAALHAVIDYGFGNINPSLPIFP